jgi:hypothetical protein
VDGFRERSRAHATKPLAVSKVPAAFCTWEELYTVSAHGCFCAEIGTLACVCVSNSPALICKREGNVYNSTYLLKSYNMSVLAIVIISLPISRAGHTKTEEIISFVAMENSYVVIFFIYLC